MAFKYKYARPAISVDIILFGLSDSRPSLLVINRGLEPFKNQLALPGGFVRIDETVEDAARRELKEETSISNVQLEQLSVFSAINRDPRERVISVAFFGIVNSTDFTPKGGSDANAAKWIPLHQKTMRLAFDHNKIVKHARDWLSAQMYSDSLVLKFLPDVFTLTQAQNTYEALLDTHLDKRNFRKKLLSSGLIKPTGKKLKNVPYRSPDTYRLAKKGKELSIAAI